ncbi:hypothetical protein NC652_030367 [Populus alba x Populus x berolinensis]|nr:hypothetical protein NC652_030367 [Populus alba x Populus x berolinensis]
MVVVQPRGAGAGGSPRLKLLEMKKLHWGAAVLSLLCSEEELLVEHGAKLRTCNWNKEGAAGALIEVMVHLIQWRAAGFSRRRVEYLLLIVVDREEKVASVGRSWAVVSMEDCWMFTVLWSYVAAHSVEELLGLECWSLTVLVQEEVAPLEEENLHHWILVWSSLVQKDNHLYRCCCLRRRGRRSWMEMLVMPLLSWLVVVGGRVLGNKSELFFSLHSHGFGVFLWFFIFLHLSN